MGAVWTLRSYVVQALGNLVRNASIQRVNIVRNQKPVPVGTRENADVRVRSCIADRTVGHILKDMSAIEALMSESCER